MRLSTIILWALLGNLGLMLLLFISGNLMYLPVPWQVWTLLSVAIPFGIAGFVCAVAMERGRLRRLMLSGMIASIAAPVLWFVAAMVESVDPNGYGPRIAVWPTVWAGLMMLIGLLRLPPGENEVARFLRVSANVILAILAAQIVLAITFYPSSAGWPGAYRYEQLAFRWGLGLGALAACAVALSLLHAMMLLLTGEARAQTPRLGYWLSCPRCGQEQRALTGVHPCQRCGLRTKVELT